MSCTKQIQLILEEFAKSIELDDLTLDETGHCCLTFDDTIFVSIESDEAGNRMLMYSFIGAPSHNKEEVYAKVLEGNFFWKNTQGATLCRDPKSGGIVLMDKIELSNLNYPIFEKKLEDFVNTAESWMSKLASDITNESASEEQQEHDNIKMSSSNGIDPVEKKQLDMSTMA